MLIMSDLQLLTGLAIMISGFTQLRCGLSTYHWLRVIHLAWFSSVTHLCCLTFLRDYLRKNKMMQLWRISGMVAQSLMLIYAFTTTSRYEWAWPKNDDFVPQEPIQVTPYDEAICFIRPSLPKHWADSNSFQRMIISMAFMGFAMANRVLRLYHPSHAIFIKTRRWCSNKARSLLWSAYGNIIFPSIVASMAAIIVYRPLLALFLMTRLLLDMVSSKAFEVDGIMHLDVTDC